MRRYHLCMAYVFSETLYSILVTDGQYGELTENDVELVVRQARSRVCSHSNHSPRMEKKRARVFCLFYP